jgi:two-component system phosphate regulon response regulator OmpR
VAPNGRILIVEDDVSVREMLAEYLGTHGYEAVQADGGAVMREAVETSLPDVVLLDVNLPGEDGFTLARFLRERYDVGIIMVTGSAELADRVAGLEVGADDYRMCARSRVTPALCPGRARDTSDGNGIRPPESLR